MPTLIFVLVKEDRQVTKDELVDAIPQVMINKIIWMLVQIPLLKMMMIASWFLAFIVFLHLETHRKIRGAQCFKTRKSVVRMLNQELQRNGSHLIEDGAGTFSCDLTFASDALKIFILTGS